MKLLLLLLFFAAPIFAMSQVRHSGKQKVYQVTIAHVRPGTSSGYLAAVKDSAIWLTPNLSSIRFNAIEQADLKKLPYKNIELVSMKRKGATGRGLLIGTLVGFATGALTGLISGDDRPCNTFNVQSSPDNFFGLGTAMCEAFRFGAGDRQSYTEVWVPWVEE